MDYQTLLDNVAAEVAPLIGTGNVADYIPALAGVDPMSFGMAIADLDGGVHGVGQWRQAFSVQSISKVFSLAMTLSRDGQTLWKSVGREPSGNPFNSLVQLEAENGVPRNPFINAGAIVVTDHLVELAGDASGALLDFLRSETEEDTIGFDADVAASEAAHGDRNASLAHFMRSYGNLRNPVPTVLEHYFRQCSLSMSCEEVALAATFLARHGVLRDGRRLLTRSEAKQINAVMLTCGTYDAAGDFAYRVGLPAKSGVGGGILAVIPQRCTICVWSPGLDVQGNSVAGAAALDVFTTMTGWSIF
ncbi:glutaminase [Umezawaea sp. NPDC059074]|uniref:glutaminase n=1 Tax=Umezawaea sp. NPDC059074 TaxID=3346716 RepID=UPI0036AF6FE9